MGGHHVAETTAGQPREVHVPDDLLRRLHCYPIRTRMGKLTPMGPINGHKLREKAADR